MYSENIKQNADACWVNDDEKRNHLQIPKTAANQFDSEQYRHVEAFGDDERSALHNEEKILVSQLFFFF